MSTLKIEGIEALQATLREKAPRVARNLMRATVQAIASKIAKDAKANAPVLTGNLKKSIKAKRAKSAPDKPLSIVTVGQGKKEKNDGYYWRFIEYGTQKMTAAPFIGPAKQRAAANMKTLLIQEFGKKLEKQLAREAKTK